MSTVIIENADSTAVAAFKKLAQSLGLKFRTKDDDAGQYNPEFVKKIKESQADFDAGRYKTINLDDLWKSE